MWKLWWKMTKLSPSAAEGKKNQRITIGKAGAPHGIHGELRIQPLTDFAGRFDNLGAVMVGDELLQVESVRHHKQFLLMKFREYPAREDAMRLTGKLLTVDRSEAAPLAEGEFYAFDIVGLEVFGRDGERLGVVENVLRTGSNDVYSVRDGGGRERLVPALKSVVKEIDVAGGRMVVDLMEEE